MPYIFDSKQNKSLILTMKITRYQTRNSNGYGSLRREIQFFSVSHGSMKVADQNAYKTESVISIVSFWELEIRD